jgi:hypothetical protein
MEIIGRFTLNGITDPRRENVKQSRRREDADIGTKKLMTNGVEPCQVAGMKHSINNAGDDRTTSTGLVRVDV